MQRAFDRANSSVLIPAVIALIFAIKYFFPFWHTLHISFISAICGLIIYLRKERREKHWINGYLLIIIVVVIIPLGFGTIGDQAISQIVCSLHGASDFETIRNYSTDSRFILCGFFMGCTKSDISGSAHLWQVCKISSLRNESLSVLLLDYDITVNIDNPFVFSSLERYRHKSLIMEPVKLFKQITSDNCKVIEFCSFDSLPLAEVVRP